MSGFLIVPSANAEDDLTGAHVDLNADAPATISGLMNGTAYRAYRLSDPSDPFTPIAANNAPDAVDDTGLVTPFETVLASIDVLANDTDLDGDTLTIQSVQNPVGGVAVIAGVAPNQTVTFTPATGFEGAASFSYTVSDGNGGTDTATVSITVSDAPVLITINTFTVGAYQAVPPLGYPFNIDATDAVDEVDLVHFTVLPLEEPNPTDPQAMEDDAIANQTDSATFLFDTTSPPPVDLPDFPAGLYKVAVVMENANGFSNIVVDDNAGAGYAFDDATVDSGLIDSVKTGVMTDQSFGQITVNVDTTGIFEGDTIVILGATSGTVGPVSRMEINGANVFFTHVTSTPDNSKSAGILKMTVNAFMADKPSVPLSIIGSTIDEGEGAFVLVKPQTVLAADPVGTDTDFVGPVISLDPASVPSDELFAALAADGQSAGDVFTSGVTFQEKVNFTDGGEAAFAWGPTTAGTTTPIAGTTTNAEVAASALTW